MIIQEIRTFGRTKTKKLNERKKVLLEKILPQISIKNIDKNKKSILEIGFGNGDHLIQLSNNYKDFNIIGAEPFINGVASCLSKITDENFNIKNKNTYIYPNDVRNIFNKDNQDFLNIKYHQIFILHPDPWPKKRHFKRRLLNNIFLSQLHNFLEQDGTIIIGTDHKGYYEWIEDEIKQTNLKIISKNIPTIKTKYQIKNKACDITRYFVLQKN